MFYYVSAALFRAPRQTYAVAVASTEFWAGSPRSAEPARLSGNLYLELADRY